MTEQIGVTLPEVEPVLYFSRRIDVVAWWPQPICT
jgi:hypothetical protein